MVVIVAAEGRHLGVLGQQLDVAAAAEGVLVVLDLDRELEHKGLALGGGLLVERGGERVEAHVVGDLEALVHLLVDEPLARADGPRAHLLACRLALGPLLHAIGEVLLKVHLGGGKRGEGSNEETKHVGRNCAGGEYTREVRLGGHVGGTVRIAWHGGGCQRALFAWDMSSRGRANRWCAFGAQERARWATMAASVEAWVGHVNMV